MSPATIQAQIMAPLEAQKRIEQRREALKAQRAERASNRYDLRK